MKLREIVGAIVMVALAYGAEAQSTTSGGSGGSSASTGAGYRSGRKVPYAEDKPQSMTVAESVTPNTVIVRPPAPKKNTSQSPTASDNGSTGSRTNASPAKRTKGKSGSRP